MQPPIECTHPDHNHNETCEDRAVSCHKDCICCDPGYFWPYDSGSTKKYEVERTLFVLGTILANPKLVKILSKYREEKQENLAS